MFGKRAIIFKAAADEKGDKDLYVERIESLGVACRVVPVLSFEFERLEELRTQLLNPASYSGIVFSSPRVVEAVRRCNVGVAELWKSKFAFSVGEKTGEEIQGLGLQPLGSEAGTGANLADFILKRGKLEKPLLIPCGNLASTTIEDRLKEGGVDTHRLVVYRTVPDPDLEESIKRVLSEGQVSTLDFVLYFSPSGVTATLPILTKLGVDLSNVKFGAIGTTTEAALSKFVKVSFVAEKPSPQHFAAALLGVLEEQS